MSNPYIHTEKIHNMFAPREVVPMLMRLVKPESVLDIGCGTGTWLKAFAEAGVIDYLGVDGDYVNRSMLQIPDNNFVAKDLNETWDLGRKFELVVSLEVAEHLPETKAELFVNTMVTHANHTIIFSAAIPGQGGQHHINEQWPTYWQEKFLKHGFYFHDVIRPLIWDNPKVDWWYRQNIFLVTKTPSAKKIMEVIHPDCFNQRLEQHQHANLMVVTGGLGVKYSAAILLRALKNWLK